MSLPTNKTGMMITMVMMVMTMRSMATTVVVTVMTDDVGNAHQPNNDQQRGCSIPSSVQTNLT